MTKRNHTRYYSHEQVQKGFASPQVEAPDLPRELRTHLIDELVAAYEAGKLTGETHLVAARIAGGLSTNLSTLEALRIHLVADGREMVDKIHVVALVVPALWILIVWIGLRPTAGWDLPQAS